MCGKLLFHAIKSTASARGNSRSAQLLIRCQQDVLGFILFGGEEWSLPCDQLAKK